MIFGLMKRLLIYCCNVANILKISINWVFLLSVIGRNAVCRISQFDWLREQAVVAISVNHDQESNLCVYKYILT